MPLKNGSVYEVINKNLQKLISKGFESIIESHLFSKSGFFTNLGEGLSQTVDFS